MGEISRVKSRLILRRFNGSLGRLDLRVSGRHRGLGCQIVLYGVVEILLAGGLFRCQRRVTIYVQFSPALHRLGIRERGPGLRQLPFSLVQHRLKRPRIDFEKQLPLLDEPAFLIALLHEIAADLRAHVGIGESIECADPLAINRHVLLLHLRDRHIRRRAGLRRYILRARHAIDHAND